MSAGKKVPDEVLERIRKAKKEDPDLTQAALAQRFGVSTKTIRTALTREEAA